MDILIIVFLFLLNFSTLYFVISTWYGQKIANRVKYWYDEDGKLQFGFDDED